MPVWICGSLLTTFQLTSSVEVSHIHRRIQSLLFQTNYPGLNSWTVCINNGLSRIASTGFFRVKRVTSIFSAFTTSGSLFTHTMDLSEDFMFISWEYWNLKSRSLNVRLNRSTLDSLITVNVHIPSSDPDIRLRHLFLYITHEYTSRINLKNRGPSQRSFVSERPFATCEDSLEVSGSAALNLLATSTTVDAL